MRRWRGSNGNTNSLLRQYLARSTDLSVFSHAELDAIAIRLNSRPRRALGFATPDEVFSGLVTRPRTPLRHEMRKVFATKLEFTHLPRTRLRTGQEPPPAQWVELALSLIKDH